MAQSWKTGRNSGYDKCDISVFHCEHNLPQWIDKIINASVCIFLVSNNSLSEKS